MEKQAEYTPKTSSERETLSGLILELCAVLDRQNRHTVELGCLVHLLKGDAPDRIPIDISEAVSGRPMVDQLAALVEIAKGIEQETRYQIETLEKTIGTPL